MTDPALGTNPEETTEEVVSPQRAAQRLYNEMAHAYREQAEEDRALNQRLLPGAVATLADENA